MAQTISQDAISETAYHLWLGAGQPDGQDQAFWFEAEAKLTKPVAKKKAAAKKAPAKKAAADKPVAKKAAAAKPAAKKTATKAKAAPKKAVKA